MSTQKISNIPNGFERLPKDLNAANLRIELKKLRASAKEGLADEDGTGAGDGKPPSTAVSKKEEEKKGGKADPKKPAAGKPAAGKPNTAAQEEDKKDDDEEGDNIMASKKELELI